MAYISARATLARLFTFKHLVLLLAVLLIAGPHPAAQSRTEGATPADRAARALNRGDFDEVVRLLDAATDPRSVALRARADIARGRYADAEKRLAPVAAAQPRSEAALDLGLLQLYLGRRQEGARTLTRVVEGASPSTAADHLRLAMAQRALGEFQDANASFRNANGRAPDDAVVNTEWGYLFLEKYELEEAQKSFQLALKADQENVAALIGIARVAVEGNPPAAGAALERAVKINPNYVPAHLLVAEMALDNQQRDEARQAVQRALQINPNSLEALALDGAIAFLEDRTDDFNRRAQEVLKINPVYGDVYRVAGDQASRNYRFDEAVQLTRRSLEVNPETAKSHADLGMHLLRTGDESGARTALETALQRDPFNSSVVTKNLLTMLDKLDTFETVTDGNLIMRFDPTEAAVMKEQAVPFAREALDALAKRWDFTIEGPILIEMFPVHDDFAVRNLGLPGMTYALGACFGRVVTLDSPRARPPGDYNWQPTLWHELAHVVTLQLSNNRVPRWLTEGISVWEEKRARPEWGREMEVSFAHALEQDKVLKLDVLNEGFTDPKLISLAYYQASLLVEHLVERFGEPSLRDLLRAYGRGLETEEALKEVYKTTLEDIQKTFDARLARDYEPLRRALKKPEFEGVPTLEDLKKMVTSHPDSFPVQMALGQALQKAGDSAGALTAFEKAAQLIPSATGDDNPNRFIAELALEKGDTARAIRALEAVMKVDHADIESARKLAALVEKSADPARAEDAYQRLITVDPFDTGAQTALGRLALKRSDLPLALRAFRTALGANPPDRATAHVDVAEAYLAAGQVAEAKKQTLAAMEIAPAYERAQDLLLKIREAEGRAN